MGSFFLKKYDSRDKKNCHTLKNNGPKLQFQLIVFPRKSGKGGSSAEEVATATQTAQLPVRQDYAFGEFDAVSIFTITSTLSKISTEHM